MYPSDVRLPGKSGYGLGRVVVTGLLAVIVLPVVGVLYLRDRWEDAKHARANSDAKSRMVGLRDRLALGERDHVSLPQNADRLY